MVPELPTAVPVSVSVNDTPRRSLVVPVVRTFHDTPPSVVDTIIPPTPTARPVLASVNETPRSGLVVPLDCCVQVLPPSTVRRIVPMKSPPGRRTGVRVGERD